MLDEMAFRFKDKEMPRSYVTTLAKHMHVRETIILKVNLLGLLKLPEALILYLCSLYFNRDMQQKIFYMGHLC